jgi:hypothetical protein
MERVPRRWNVSTPTSSIKIRFPEFPPLLDSCIAAIARALAVMLINRFPTPEFPRGDFERLGHAAHIAADGTISHRED